MKTLTVPTPRNAADAALQARVFERAIDLLSTYSYETTRAYWTRKGQPELGSEDLFAVYSPEGTMYLVDTLLKTCDCPFFAKNGYCKHYLGMEKMLLECEA